MKVVFLYRNNIILNIVLFMYIQKLGKHSKVFIYTKLCFLLLLITDVIKCNIISGRYLMLLILNDKVLYACAVLLVKVCYYDVCLILQQCKGIF